MKLNVFFSWIVGSFVVSGSATAAAATVATTPATNTGRRGLETVVIFDGVGRIEETDGVVKVINDKNGDTYEVPGGVVDVADDGEFTIYGDNTTLYGDPLGMIMNLTNEVHIYDVETGMAFVIPNGTIDFSPPEGAWTVINPDGRAVYNEWTGTVVINADGGATFAVDADNNNTAAPVVDDGAFVITDIDGGGYTITGTKMVVTMNGEKDGNGYVIIGSDGITAAYGDPGGMMVQYTDHVTLYNYIDWTTFDVAGGIVSFGIDGSWSVAGTLMTISSDAEGNLSYNMTPGGGGGDSDSTTSTTTGEDDEEKDDKEEEASDSSNITATNTTSGDDEEEKDEDTSNGSAIVPFSLLFIITSAAATAFILA